MVKVLLSAILSIALLLAPVNNAEAFFWGIFIKKAAKKSAKKTIAPKYRQLPKAIPKRNPKQPIKKAKAKDKAIAKQIINNDHSYKKHKSEFVRGRGISKKTGKKIKIPNRVPVVRSVSPKIPKKYTRSRMLGEAHKTVRSGERKKLSSGRTAFYKNGNLVIHTPKASNKGSFFKPAQGKRYFNNLK